MNWKCTFQSFGTHFSAAFTIIYYMWNKHFHFIQNTSPQTFLPFISVENECGIVTVCCKILLLLLSCTGRICQSNQVEAFRSYLWSICTSTWVLKWEFCIHVTLCSQYLHPVHIESSMLELIFGLANRLLVYHGVIRLRKPQLNEVNVRILSQEMAIHRQKLLKIFPCFAVL